MCGRRGRLYVHVSERTDGPVVRMRVPGRPHGQLHRRRGTVLHDQRRRGNNDHLHRCCDDHRSGHPGGRRRLSDVVRDHVRDDDVAVRRHHRLLQYFRSRDHARGGPPPRGHVHRTGARATAVHRLHG